MKRLALSLIWLLIAAVPAAHAQLLHPNGDNTHSFSVLATDPSGNSLTGLTLSMRVTKQPGNTSVAGTGVFTETDSVNQPGYYAYTPSAADVNTNGETIFQAKATAGTGFGTAVINSRSVLVLPINVYDSSALGLSSLTTAATQATNAATSSTANGTAIAALPTAAQNASATWAAATRTLTAFAFNPTLSANDELALASLYGSYTVAGGSVFKGAALANVPLLTDYQQRGTAVTLPANVLGSADVATLLNATAATYNTAGTIGAKINAAGSASDPLANTNGTYSTPGTIGYDISHYLDAAVSSRMATFGLPARFASMVINASGQVQHDLTQALDPTNLGDTVGGALIGARAQAFGKWTIANGNLILYAADGTTALRTFVITPTPNPASRN